MRTPEPDSEPSAFLAMAQKLRHALTERDELVRPYREAYDRAQDDLRMVPEKRAAIAAEFLRAAHRGNHLYEDRIAESLEEYREAVTSKEEIRR
jgi:hypothetical protein